MTLQQTTSVPYHLTLRHLFDPYDPPHTSFVQRLKYWAEQFPTAVAYYFLIDGEDEEVHFTYEELDQRANTIAAQLVSMGMRGERALMLYPPGLDFVSTFYGCLYAGVIPVPAFPPRRNRNMNRLAAIAHDAEAKLALTVAEVIERVDVMLAGSPVLNQLTWLATDEIPDDPNAICPDYRINDSTIAALQYTSGSTGSPKGVVLTHRNMMHNCGIISGAFEFSRTGCGMSWLPTYHDMGLLGGMLSPMYFGRTSVLFSPMAFLQKPVRWLRAITRYEATISGGPNFAYALCTEKITAEECEDLDLHTWDVAFNGAEPIRAETLEAFTRKFAPYGFRAETNYPCYGMAETTLIVSGGYKQDPPIIRSFDSKAIESYKIIPLPDNDPAARRLVGCGHVLPEEIVVIVDPETHVPTPPDQVGEIWVTGPSVGQGYWKKPEETELTFRAKLVGDEENRWLRTGDLGFLDDGELFVTGRLKDLIIIRGVNRYPQDIEETVEKASERLRSSGAAAFAVEVEDRERLVVVCEVERRRNAEWDNVIHAIRRDVAAEHELPPDAVILVRAGSIPKTSSGKIQRHAVRREFLKNKLLAVSQWFAWRRDGCEADSTSLQPASTNGKQQPDANPGVVKIVMETVQHIAEDRAQDLGLDTNIVVDLGLDSIQRLQIANSLEETFGGRFPDEELHQIETVREVALSIEKHMGTEPVANDKLNGEHVPRTPNTNGNIPASHYRFTSFPEYVRLQQSKDLLRATGVRDPFFKVQAGVSRDTTVINDRELINFASFNYLGLSGDPRVSEAAKKAIDDFGTSVSASRVASGEKTIHGELERELAEFLRTEGALTFVGEHSALETTVGQMFGAGDLVLHDALVDNGIIKGAELSGARRRPFEHNNLQEVADLLNDVRGQYRRVLIAVEGLYSLDGDFPDLPRFIELKNRFHAMLLVDEAHSLGTMGMCGRGIGEHFGADASDIDLWAGTLSKSLGSSGGFMAGGAELIEYLRYTAPGFVYETGLSPANAAAALAALRILRAEPERVANLQANSRLLTTLAKQRGLTLGNNNGTPVVPVILGNSLHAMQLSARLFERGISAQPVIHPVVQEKLARVRLFVSAAHSEAQMRTTVEILAEELAKFDLKPTAPVLAR